jgi:CelD/BcsL family acetyltransferase involved in cellulose biosynthesis
MKKIELVAVAATFGAVAAYWNSLCELVGYGVSNRFGWIPG